MITEEQKKEFAKKKLIKHLFRKFGISESKTYSERDRDWYNRMDDETKKEPR